MKWVLFCKFEPFLVFSLDFPLPDKLFSCREDEEDEKRRRGREGYSKMSVLVVICPCNSIVQGPGKRERASKG